MKLFVKCLASFVLCVVLHAAGEDFRHPGICDDCFQRHGFPFTSSNAGGFVGGAAIYWPEYLANFAAFIVTMFAIVWLWDKAVNRCRESCIMQKRNS
jgi:hypothetical protein